MCVSRIFSSQKRIQRLFSDYKKIHVNRCHIFKDTFILVLHGNFCFNQQVLLVKSFARMMISTSSNSNSNENQTNSIPPPLLTYQRKTQRAPPLLLKSLMIQILLQQLSIPWILFRQLFYMAAIQIGLLFLRKVCVVLIISLNR